jgi:hypothetical protein
MAKYNHISTTFMPKDSETRIVSKVLSWSDGSDKRIKVEFFEGTNPIAVASLSLTIETAEAIRQALNIFSDNGYPTNNNEIVDRISNYV